MVTERNKENQHNASKCYRTPCHISDLKRITITIVPGAHELNYCWCLLVGVTENSDFSRKMSLYNCNEKLHTTAELSKFVHILLWSDSKRSNYTKTVFPDGELRVKYR